METAFFIGTGAMALEALLFVGTVLVLVVQAIRRGSSTSRYLWWLVGLTALAGAVAFLLSVRYVINDPHDQSWSTLVSLSVALPLVLAAVVWVALHRQSRR